MAKVKGIWTFKDVLTDSGIYEEVNFIYDNRQSYAIKTGYYAGNPFYALYYVFIQEDGQDVEENVYAYEEYADWEIEVGWHWDSAKTIDFGETEQEVSDVFYAWLVENAVQVVDNIKIDITENGTTTLATAGKYCNRNIDVNVNVPDADELAQGTIAGDYTSDKVTSLRNYALYECSNLTAVSLPNCTSIGGSSFYGCTNIESVDLPMCTSIQGSNAFDSATKLKTINIPNLTTIVNGSRTCVACESLEEFNAPNLTALTNTLRMFATCDALKKVAFPKLGGATISAYTFYSCDGLTTLILGGSVLNPLENVNAFYSSKIEYGDGYIYVPDDLVESYKTATNWATFADIIKPISELEE